MIQFDLNEYLKLIEDSKALTDYLDDASYNVKFNLENYVKRKTNK